MDIIGVHDGNVEWTFGAYTYVFIEFDTDFYRIWRNETIKYPSYS